MCKKLAKMGKLCAKNYLRWANEEKIKVNRLQLIKKIRQLIKTHGQIIIKYMQKKVNNRHFIRDTTAANIQYTNKS